jgi:hypothetical protein
MCLTYRHPGPPPRLLVTRERKFRGLAGNSRSCQPGWQGARSVVVRSFAKLVKLFLLP